ncbi:MAG: class I SAM-dependent methyltransferase [Candidatus Helarchaeota archaeon]
MSIRDKTYRDELSEKIVEQLLTNPYTAHSRMLELVGKDKTVLEVGCATGYISKKLKENGCKVTGIEINPQSAEIAKEYCEQIIVGNVEELKDLPLNRDYFDFILFADVLEHLLHPTRTLAKLKKYLKKDGKIFISLPNIANYRVRLNLLVGRFNYTEIGLLDKTHIRFFTIRTAKQLIKDAGLKLEGIDVAPSWNSSIKLLNKLYYVITRLFKGLLAYNILILASK